MFIAADCAARHCRAVDLAIAAAHDVRPIPLSEISMDTMKTHGAFSWSELMTSDDGKACDFYGSLFGWKIEAMDMPGGKYHVAKIGDVPVGGLMKWPPESAAMPSAWSCYVTVDSVDATIAKCKSLGGSVLMEPMDVPTVGRMATIRDPQGAAINVITYEAKP
jgi:predicted enzyme related to lactoylglutathione lyase